MSLIPPQTIISLPVHTAVCRKRAEGAPVGRRLDRERDVALGAGGGIDAVGAGCGRLEAGGRLAVLDGLDEFREHLGGELTVTVRAGTAGDASRQRCSWSPPKAV